MNYELVKEGLGLLTPNSSRFYKYYNLPALFKFLSEIPKYDLPITKTETIYVESKSISQSKLRDVGFKITRSKDNATFIIIDNFLDVEKNPHSYGYSDRITIRFNDRTRSEDFIDRRIDDLGKDYKYVQVKDIYPYMYKYEGNFELYSNIMQLLNSNNDTNTTMAMEFMVNANWEDDKVYLMDIFTNHCEKIYYNPYRTSISFKGFSESLGFNFRTVNLRTADDYRSYCSKEEHHQFVYNKFSERFKKDLEDLCKEYKIKLDDIKYSIDYNTQEKEC